MKTLHTDPDFLLIDLDWAIVLCDWSFTLSSQIVMTIMNKTADFTIIHHVGELSDDAAAIEKEAKSAWESFEKDTQQ